VNAPTRQAHDRRSLLADQVKKILGTGRVTRAHHHASGGCVSTVAAA